MTEFPTRLRELSAAIDATVVEFRGLQSDTLLNNLGEMAARLDRVAESIQPSAARAAMLTPAQGRVLVFVRSFIAQNGHAPTRQEIADAFFCHPNNIQCHLKALEKKGAVTLVSGVARNIRINKRTLETVP